jgi:hypothetical protein
MTGCSATGCACSNGSWPPRPGMVTCPWHPARVEPGRARTRRGSAAD